MCIVCMIQVKVFLTPEVQLVFPVNEGVHFVNDLIYPRPTSVTTYWQAILDFHGGE